MIGFQKQSNLVDVVPGTSKREAIHQNEMGPVRVRGRRRVRGALACRPANQSRARGEVAIKMRIERGSYGVRFDGSATTFAFSKSELGAAYSRTDIFHNGHIITVSPYLDYISVEADEAATFFEVMVDGEFFRHGFTSPELATAGAVDFIDNGVPNNPGEVGVATGQLR
jgi:hypothetical protein